MTAWEIEHLGYGIDHKTTDAEIRAYTAANRAECGICPGVECFCEPLKPSEGIRVHRLAGTAYTGHVASLPPDLYEGRD